jgi:flavin reductase (DIM6/NTAB) family NADH-FMN oxidoreductase RutF
LGAITGGYVHAVASPDPDPFAELVARLDAPLLLVTTAADDERAGCIVGFHSQSSIDPVRYSVWISKENHTYRVALFASHLALHLVTPDDHGLLELFGGTSGDHTEKFALCDWAPGPGGVPLLTQCPNRVVIERTSVVDVGGDHVCFAGAPVRAEVDPDHQPTAMRLSDAGDVQPGHPTDEHMRDARDAAAGAGHAIDLG